MRNGNVPLRALLVTAAVLLARPLLAQTTPWLDRGLTRAFWAEAAIPRFKNSENFSALLLTLGARMQTGRSVRGIVEVPLATSSLDYGQEDGFLLGNPYFGIESGSPTQGVRGSFGVRLPIVGHDAPEATVLGAMMADFEHFEAFTPKMITVQGDLAQRWRRPSGLVTEFGVTPAVMKPEEGDVELLAGYRAGIGVDGDRFEGMLWLSGRWWVTSEDASLGEATVFQMTAAGTLKTSHVRPTFFVRVPLDDDLKQMLNTVIGVGVTIGF